MHLFNLLFCAALFMWVMAACATSHVLERKCSTAELPTGKVMTCTTTTYEWIERK